MDVLELSRWQFAITTIYHFLFVPLTLGLSIFLALLETCSVITKRPAWKEQSRKLAKFFGTIFLINTLCLALVISSKSNRSVASGQAEPAPQTESSEAPAAPAAE